jgi:hypothetical protein
MKTSHLITLLSLLGLLFFTSCEKGDGNIVDFVYGETQCADPWGGAADDEVLKGLIEDYLSDEGIDIISVDFTPYDGQIHCQACTCSSGRDIEVRASEEFTDKLEALGFELD